MNHQSEIFHEQQFQLVHHSTYQVEKVKYDAQPNNACVRPSAVVVLCACVYHEVGEQDQVGGDSHHEHLVDDFSEVVAPGDERPKVGDEHHDGDVLVEGEYELELHVGGYEEVDEANHESPVDEQEAVNHLFA